MFPCLVSRWLFLQQKDQRKSGLARPPSSSGCLDWLGPCLFLTPWPTSSFCPARCHSQALICASEAIRESLEVRMACPGSPSSSGVKPGTDPWGGPWPGPIPSAWPSSRQNRLCSESPGAGEGGRGSLTDDSESVRCGCHVTFRLRLAEPRHSDLSHSTVTWK